MTPKRILFNVLIILLLFGVLSGCTRSSSSGEPTIETIVVTSAPEEIEPTPQMTRLAPNINTGESAGEAAGEETAVGEEAFLLAIKETRRLILEWPPTMRKGDADLIRITLEMDKNGEITPTVEIEGHESDGTKVTIPDLYDTHVVKVKAQLNLAGISFSPATQPEKRLQRGESVSFYWSVNPSTEGDFMGTVLFQLSFVPKEGGQETQISLSEQIFKISVKTLFGMSGKTVRIIGWAFSLVGAIFSFDDIIKFLKNQFGTKKPDST